MIRDIIPFAGLWKKIRPRGSSATLALIRFFEERLGASFVYDASAIPFMRADMADLFEMAEKLREAGTISAFGPSAGLSDEPPLSYWNVRFRDTADESTASGSAMDDDRHSFTCALAEALERHIWFEKSDYFLSPTTATCAEIARKGGLLDPESFAGFSKEQREIDTHLRLSADTKYLWVRAESFTSPGRTWVPAQTVSVARGVRKEAEPKIRHFITTGLATHPDRIQALLSGALEIIERDAYMIMWFNQLTLPRLDLAQLRTTSPELDKLLKLCERYRLRAHVVRMITDAPAYALCAVIEDETGHAPRIAIGLKCHRDAANAAEGAILEALRARRGSRSQLAKEARKETLGAKLIDAKGVGHYDRLLFWAQDDNWKKLSFLHEGPLEEARKEAWTDDTAPEHLKRLTAWCKTRSYDYASVAFTNSNANATPWHIEMSIIPQLQSMHLSERLPSIGGERLTSIPKAFGYSPREPFTTFPHPFA